MAQKKKEAIVEAPEIEISDIPEVEASASPEKVAYHELLTKFKAQHPDKWEWRKEELLAKLAALK